VLKKRDCVPAVVAAGGKTVGLRCPDHPVALALLRAASVPLATPSANRSGNRPAVDAEQVRKELGGRIDIILNGGTCPLGIASTVLDLTQSPPKILRLAASPESSCRP
jgi:L-threonylcarbamoyladenylate synthase